MSQHPILVDFVTGVCKEFKHRICRHFRTTEYSNPPPIGPLCLGRTAERAKVADAKVADTHLSNSLKGQPHHNLRRMSADSTMKTLIVIEFKPNSEDDFCYFRYNTYWDLFSIIQYHKYRILDLNQSMRMRTQLNQEIQGQSLLSHHN